MQYRFKYIEMQVIWNLHHKHVKETKLFVS